MSDNRPFCSCRGNPDKLLMCNSCRMLLVRGLPLKEKYLKSVISTPVNENVTNINKFKENRQK